MKTFVTALLVSLTVTSGLQAQFETEVDSQEPFATRNELTSLLEVLNATLVSPVYSDTLKGVARVASGVVRTRLDEGDFQVGDRILVSVEANLLNTDTLPVLEGLILEVPAMGDFSVRGILRAELEDALTLYISSLIRDAVVRVSPLIRISIVGSVGNQGFYVVPSKTLLSDVVMEAGGPTGDAALNDVYVERNTRILVRPDAVRAAFINGSTLDQLGIREGDQVVVPDRGTGLGGLQTGLRSFTLILSIPASIFALTRLF